MPPYPKIPGYELKKFLGSGGAANVFLAVDSRRGRLVAIKVLARQIFGDAQTVKRFFLEAQALSRLHHPNILHVYETGRTEHLHFMVMEFLPESLKERIRRRHPIPPDESLAIANQVAAALFYAHGRGFIHRDVKPDNIMFRRDGTPVILDFGIARVVEATSHLTRSGTILGTPRYMSPEQLQAKRLDGRSDLYSLGVVLFEMLTGKPPFRGTHTVAVAVKHMSEPIPRLPSELGAIQPLIDRLLAKEPGQRLGSAAEWNEQITPLLRPLRLPRADTSKTAFLVVRGREKTRLSGRPKTPAFASRHRPRGSRRRRPRFLLHLLLVLALAGAILFYWDDLTALASSLWRQATTSLESLF